MEQQYVRRRGMTNLELMKEIVRRFDTLTLQGMQNWETATAMEQLMLRLLENLSKEGEHEKHTAGE